MLFLSVFSTIYEALIGPNPLAPEYREGIFSSVGLLTLITGIVLSLLFYIALGRWKPVFHKVVHWVIMLSLNSVLAFFIAYMLVDNEIGLIDAYALRLAFINILYAAIYFFIFSLLLKRFSIFAKHTPF